MAGEKSQGESHCDVLVVGAGPTGLTLAAQLLRFGVRPLIIDKGLDRARESRALAVQPRTLEVLRSLGLADQLIRRGNPATRMRIVAGHSTATVKLFDIGLDDTAFPYLLFVSQAQTEAVLLDQLSAAGVQVRRGVALERCAEEGSRLACTLRRGNGSQQLVSARYVVGCDGAHSTVRTQAGMPFVGASYPQTFVLADLAADGLEPDTVHAYVTDTGPLLFFPLVDPAPWRVITVRRPVGDRQLSDDVDVDVDVNAAPVSLAELQAAVDAGTGGRVRVRDAVWMTAFRLHHRHAARYRSGRAFVAGDAAHVHSPAGAQGMNTGIQDAANLGWKLALVCHGVAPDDLLDSYDAERRPVGEFVLRFTDRAFTAVTSKHPLVRAVRTRVVPRVLPLVLRFRAGRAAAFRTVSQLGVAYPRSPAVEGARSRRTRGAQPGDRLPDAVVTRDGEELWLQEALSAPTYHLLLCGPVDGWDGGYLTALVARHPTLVTLHHLTRRPGPAGLSDRDGHAVARLRVAGCAQLVVRPDGHIGYRADNFDLAGAARYLARWLARPEQSDPS